jgi:hypothetical protein
MAPPKWDRWACTHACTAFFRIPKEEVEHLVPKPLVLALEHGRAVIEVGFVRFRAGNHDLPAVDEIAWAIQVERTMRRTSYAFYAMSLTSENAAFLDVNERLGFRVFRPPVRFEVDLDRRAYDVRDGSGARICTLRHNPEGGLTFPAPIAGLFVGASEVFTGVEGALERRRFEWRGVARPHFAPLVASTLVDHPFFGGVKVSRAEPIPTKVFSSVKAATRAAQLFTAGAPFP